MIKDFLRKHKIKEKDTLKEYIEYLEKEAENLKASNYILIGVPGLILALFIPIWNNFNTWFFREGINDLEDGVVYLLLSLLVITIVSVLIGLYRSIAKEFFDTEVKKIKELVSLLEDIVLTWDDSYFKRKSS